MRSVSAVGVTRKPMDRPTLDPSATIAGSFRAGRPVAQTHHNLKIDPSTGPKALGSSLSATHSASMPQPHEQAFVPWEIVSDSEFDEMVASIIVNPQTGIARLRNALVRRVNDGSTLLHLFAGGENCQELVSYLLEAGIPPDTADCSGWTPLLEAAQEGQIPNCKVLLAHGATPTLGCSAAKTPLMAAAKVGNSDMTQWLLKQPDTCHASWDNDLFAALLKNTPTAANLYLDLFAVVQGHIKCGKAAVKYSSLRLIYGEPETPVERTALGLALSMRGTGNVLSHRVMKYVMKVKWTSFAREMFIKEFTAYCTLLISYYVTTIWASPDWIQLKSADDYWVAFSRFIAWICSMYLLLHVEYNECRGNGFLNYISSFWNWLNVVSYATTLATIPMEFYSQAAEIRNCLLALLTVTLWINLLQFLQISTKTGLLITMMGRMLRDVYQFFLVYSVFVLGFSGGFYLLFPGQAGYEDFTKSFFTVFLMLFGQLTYDPFDNATGWTWHMSNALLFIYLVSGVIVLLNILIAMMAMTYSVISDTAEERTWRYYAQAILRMESSLSQRKREKKYFELIDHLAPVAGESVAVVDFAESPSLTSPSAPKRMMMASIVEKIATISDPAKHRREGSGGKTPPIKPNATPRSPALMLVPQLKALDLNALKKSLLLKSSFDIEDEYNAGVARPLGLLEDGVRYETPEARDLNDEPTPCAAANSELLVQVQELSSSVKDLPSQIRDLTAAMEQMQAQLQQLSMAQTVPDPAAALASPAAM